LRAAVALFFLELPRQFAVRLPGDLKAMCQRIPLALHIPQLRRNPLGLLLRRFNLRADLKSTTQLISEVLNLAFELSFVGAMEIGRHRSTVSRENGIVLEFRVAGFGIRAHLKNNKRRRGTFRISEQLETRYSVALSIFIQKQNLMEGSYAIPWGWKLRGGDRPAQKLALGYPQNSIRFRDRSLVSRNGISRAFLQPGIGVKAHEWQIDVCSAVVSLENGESTCDSELSVCTRFSIGRPWFSVCLLTVYRDIPVSPVLKITLPRLHPQSSRNYRGDARIHPC
jgi:hypothetical protein